MLLLLGACTQKKIVIGVSQCCGGVWREKVNNEMRLAQYQYKNVDLLFTTAENDGQRQARQDRQYDSQEGRFNRGGP